MNPAPVFGQGFNNNEWVFGDCGTGQNNYLSFGKGGDPIVRSLPSGVIVGQNNNAVAIDPISGNIIFYSNGVLVYDANNQILEGVAPGINGNIDGQQQVGIGILSYEPQGDRLYYVFYVSPAGDLQYALIDMNAPGQAVGNEPPLGEIIEKDQVVVGAVTGPIMVVKTPQSPSYLISIEGGSIVSRRIGANQGEFTLISNAAVPFTPKFMVFDEATQRILLIPEDPNQDIVVLDFDAASGTFGSQQPISQSANGQAYGGASFSPDGAYIYFSRGNQLFRIPSNDLTAAPEEIQLDNPVHAIYDVKAGPDGRLYYIYEEVLGGPQLLGRVNNPNETDLDNLSVTEDPFNGTDFCGRIFPQFAPNANINPTVDFIWEPEQPCANNPVQLTSLITPENYRPVSFEWTFNPPLVDEDGQPVDIDFTQEHLLIPAEATANQSVDVTLTVRFADGSTQTVNKTINLLENDLQVQFTTQDTTVCEGACVDIGSMLEVQQGGGQGGGQGGQGNYEYFWSNIREWRSNKDNCVDLPGLYWVLVREQGSSCYAYGSVRVRIWDLLDQSNNVWYFGNGAGLDFNPDPNNPSAPLPRPVGHNQNIPAGTTTISDGTGQVLFFTDGETVWDLNGNIMENGDSIGGSNLSSQSVIAVPVPTDETIFYLFTTQRAQDGSNQVKFSVVDIKAENQNGVGNVVSKDNFLFSPSTEHSAALAAGDTTWVLFHELGNNTFRAYPVSIHGIGQPVLSSVGSSHGFNSGVGSMKFSPDGTKVAVTISDGACSRLEIFDFNQNTGRMTEYALIDLGCNNDQVYGLEFSNDGSRVYVSYRGSSGKIDEFLIQAPEQSGNNQIPCATCFNTTSTREQREACILNSTVRNTLTTAGPFGALQIGPDGVIYVARPGQNVLGTINAAQDCNRSSYTEIGTSTLFGTSNLGLPSFVQQSGSSIPDPALAGTPFLCIDPQNGAVGEFEGGGEPDIDSYFWTIVHEDGTSILNNYGGPGETFQTLEQPFTRPGLYTVSLRVDRCGNPTFYEASMEVQVIAPPTLTLPGLATLCLGTPVALTAIDGYDPAAGLYDFEWRNAQGTLFGDNNSNTIFVNEESIFTVVVSHRRPADVPEEFFNPCPATASVFVGPPFDFDLTQSADQVCFDGDIVEFSPNTPVVGDWFYQVQGTNNRVPLGRFFELELLPSTLPGPGIYDIIFLAEDPIVPGCLVEKVVELIVWPLPAVEAVVLTDADACGQPTGSFEITALTDAEEILIVETGQRFTNVSAGDILPVISNLEPGLYTIRATNDAGCRFTLPVQIQNLNPPTGISDYTVEVFPEICGPIGVENGTLSIVFQSGPQTGTYRIVRIENGQEFTGTFTNVGAVAVSLEGGTYTVEVIDQFTCSVPAPGQYIIEDREQAIFSIPDDLSICQEFTFTPVSQQNLIYTLVGPNNLPISPNQDGSYTISVTGQYTMTGTDPSGLLCPAQRQITILNNIFVDFAVSFAQVDCDLGQYFDAILNNSNPGSVNFFWRNEAGTIVGRDQRFFPPQPGTYSLEVQPRSGALCPPRVITFTAPPYTLRVDASLEVIPFCVEDAFTVISLQADQTFVDRIDWFFIVNNNPVALPQYENLTAINVSDEGIYRVVLTSADGCELAREQIQVIRSSIVPPIVNPVYTICAVEGVTATIDPGTYATYRWLLNGVEISNAPQLTPTVAGNYLLTVGDELGCTFTVPFRVNEDCALRVIFPDAMTPSNPNKRFAVYTNDFVSELEVFIFNRWGQLIFYCQQANINGEINVCQWDGTVDGTYVPSGVYPVVVRFRSQRQNVTNSITKSIVVIE